VLLQRRRAGNRTRPAWTPPGRVSPGQRLGRGGARSALGGG
jgi:hypothetical protein